jgi:hypothetical protein
MSAVFSMEGKKNAPLITLVFKPVYYSLKMKFYLLLHQTFN